MTESADFRNTRIQLKHGVGQIPAMGFGTLIPDPVVTKTATRAALEAGFRHFDGAERYQNEREVGEVLQEGLAAGTVTREDLFITTKVWNTNHRPERVEPAFEGSLGRLGLDYLDLYLIHTPFAFQPGDEFDPRDENGNVIYDCHLGAIQNAAKLGAAIHAVPGVVEHGLFVGIATTLLVATPGEVEVINK